MPILRSRVTLAVLLALTFGLTLIGEANAEQPASVERLFAAFYPEGSAPDFEGDASLNIIAHPTQAHHIDRFQVDERNGFLSGLAMIDGEGTHVAIGGAESIVFRWVYDSSDPTAQNPIPPSGARAKSGATGDVIVLGYYYVGEITDGCSSNCGWVVVGEDDRDPSTPPPFGADARIVVAVGLFSK